MADQVVPTIVGEAIEAAAQAVIQPHIPLALVPELLTALQGLAMRDVMAMRVDQVALHGHTIDNDDMLPIGWLPMEARKAFERARDMMHGETRDLAAMRGLLVEGVALGLAAIDRLDRAMKSGER
jgi:hypothetical protein